MLQSFYRAGGAYGDGIVFAAREEPVVWSGQAVSTAIYVTMSLKSKIEAVIYAAEEPVTLAQLAAIFAADIPFASPELPLLDEPVHANPIETSEVTIIDADGTMADLPCESPAENGHTAAIEQAPLLAETAAAPEEPTGVVVDSDAAAKRAARQRDREVRQHLSAVVEELITDYIAQDRGIEIREIAGGFRMATKPEYHDAVRAFVKSLKPVMKLSLQALETLAVIAYKQPVTAPEIAEIRGVDSGGVLASLISRKLVTTAGRKQVIGRPILYKTTKEFLLRFGLKDVAELPSMEEFEKMAGELAESDAIEADSMHEKAGIEPAAGDCASSLPLEEVPVPDTPAPETSAPEESPATESQIEQDSASEQQPQSAAIQEDH